MSHIHTFERPEGVTDARQVGEVFSPEHSQYAEGAHYAFKNGAHQLTLFWPAPTAAEISGFQLAPIEVGLYSQGLATFLLYKIDKVCEWSDVAFNVHLVPRDERELPDDPTGERARLLLTLVDADSGIIRAKRMVSLDKVMTQALRHVMREQAQTPFDAKTYEQIVQLVHARFPDSAVMADAAEFLEATLG